MGTPEFAVPSLEILLENKFNIVAVITAADKPQGRSQKLIPSPVKECALKYTIPVLQPTNLKAPLFLEELKSYQANLYEPLIGVATQQSAWTNLSTRFAGSIDSAQEPDNVVVISQAWNEALIWFTTTKKYVAASFVTYGMELDKFEAAKLELEAMMKQATGHSA